MTQSPDDLRIRDLLQRLKHVDEQHVPAFVDVLRRPARKPVWQRATSIRLVIVCSTAVTLLIATWLTGSIQNNPGVQSDPLTDGNIMSTQPSIALVNGFNADIDFDHLRGLVAEYCGASEGIGDVGVPVWFSRTESLLAINYYVPRD